MKRVVIIFGLLFFASGAIAQDKAGFYLIPKQPDLLYPGKSVSVSLHYAPFKENDPLKDAGSGSGLSPYVVRWTVNGKNMDALGPADGKLAAAHGFDLSTVTYTAPLVAPAKNPVAVAIQVKTKDNSTLWLVCNINIAEAQYKITMDAEQALPLAGQDIRLHGECFANLKTAVDGTYFLEPLDKTRNMQVKVEKAVLAEKDGASQKLTAPFTYTIPFLFTIDKMDKAQAAGNATMNLYYTSPQKGQVIWTIQGNGQTIVRTLDIDKGTLTTSPGATIQMGAPDNAGQNAVTMSDATQLNLIAGIHRMDISKTKEDISRNMAGEEDMKELAKRMQAHENDPDYFKTRQGKADLQRLMALRQKIGGNISNTSKATKSLNAQIDDKYANDPDYINSKGFKEDRVDAYNSAGEDVLRYGGKTPSAQVAPGSASLRIEGKFNSKSQQAFYAETKGSTPGGGAQTTVFKIKVEKMK